MTIKTTNEVVVCKAKELVNGQRKVVTVKHMTIVVLRVDEKLYAFNGMCPHQGAPLEFGSTSGAMQPTEPHHYKYGCHNEIIRCPLHGWAFNMETGHSLFNEKIKIRKYKVREENGLVLLSVKEKQENITVSDVSVVCC